MNKKRLQSFSETCLGTIQAATTTTRNPNTPAPNTAPKRIAIHLWPYHTRTAKVSVPNSFDGTQEVKSKVFAIQIVFQVIFIVHLFPKNKSNPVFSLFYLTREASSWAQKTTLQLLKGPGIKYAQFTHRFYAMFFKTKKKVKK